MPAAADVVRSCPPPASAHSPAARAPHARRGPPRRRGGTPTVAAHGGAAATGGGAAPRSGRHPTRSGSSGGRRGRGRLAAGAEGGMAAPCHARHICRWVGGWTAGRALDGAPFGRGGAFGFCGALVFFWPGHAGTARALVSALVLLERARAPLCRSRDGGGADGARRLLRHGRVRQPRRRVRPPAARRGGRAGPPAETRGAALLRPRGGGCVRRAPRRTVLVRPPARGGRGGRLRKQRWGVLHPAAVGSGRSRERG
ncbi:hypothetical protein BU14_0527s0007 [Porphyra umbilicalis]|uniref:Uncharacterized protein n=1 Tax=Porphyra umbilicalis TaxID=2786 RepID=A0A1X6NSA4_PORUM|nr:hypothetical protein BU14_0527s0007 [Porphyra umbilicalis]|eukprot:OSX71494.1 hypothetical protein BU14_0527s0007 [Porphyra umbilicalis]